jgi:hypothetical protein
VLEFVWLGRIASPVADVDDDEISSVYPMVDEIGITGHWKHSDTGSVGLASESWIPCKQLAR